MTFYFFTVFLLHIFPFLADFSRCPVPGAKKFLVQKTSLYENGHNFISVYDINIPSLDKSCANTLALIWSLYELKMLTESKHMSFKQNPSRTWYISLTTWTMVTFIGHLLVTWLKESASFRWNSVCRFMIAAITDGIKKLSE